MTATLRLDLHVHSAHSPDGRVPLEEWVGQLGLAGVQGFALTDHNTLDGHQRLRELAREYPMYVFLPGVEVSTREGHLLVYGVDELPPIRRPLDETLDWVRARGAVAILAHPFRWAHGVGRRVAERARADGIETVNGHNAVLTNARAELLAAHRGLAETGGSDCHELSELGRAYTEFPLGGSSVEELLGELQRRHTQGGGTSLSVGRRIRLGIRTGVLRAARGFRPI